MQIKATSTDLNAMRAAAGEASEMLKSLANRHRLLILCQLVEGERSVGELATFLDIRDTAASQHLALLRRDGLVCARRDGQTIWYSIADSPAQKIVATLFCIYCKPQRPRAASAVAKSSKTGSRR